MSFEVRFLFTFLAAVLACYRLAQAFALDEVFEPVRSFAGRRAAMRYTGKNRILRVIVTGTIRAWRGIAYLLNCPFCIGFWLALPLSLIVANLSSTIETRPVSLVELLLMWFAIAGGQAFLESQRK